MPDSQKPARKRLVGADDIDLFGVNLRKTFPLPDTVDFEELLQAIERLEAQQSMK